MAERVDRATREIDASASEIYAAFSTASALESWLPPTGMTGDVLEHDFREGGSYRIRLRYTQPGANSGKTSDDSDEVEVRFVRLVPAARIEQAIEFVSDQPQFSGVMRMVWTFEEAESRTRVRIECSNVPEGITPHDHEVGLNSSLEKLAAFVEGR